MTSATERVRIDSTGNVGIGTDNPSTSLDIVRAGVQPLRIESTTSDSVQVLLANTAGNALIRSVGSDIVLPSGNVGIGTDDPNRTLTVSSTSGVPAELVSSSTNSLLAFFDVNTGVRPSLGSDGSDLVFNANGERMRIDSSGTTTVTGGFLAAQPGAGNDAFAAGTSAGEINQATNAVAIGNAAGYTGQGTHAVAIGLLAGRTDQGASSVAVGRNAAHTNQGTTSVAIGYNAGQTNQFDNCVAVGNAAGTDDQGDSAVAVGALAGTSIQGERAVAIGRGAGQLSQGGDAVAIGYAAGSTNQGIDSVAIGTLAGQTSQAANSIVISSAGVSANGPEANSIRLMSSSTKYLHYNGTDTWAFKGGDVYVPNDSIVVGATSAIGTAENAKTGVTLYQGGAISNSRNSALPNVFLSKIGQLNGEYLQFARDGNDIGNIDYNGSVMRLNTTSDERLKKNIAPAGSALDVIKGIEVVSHDWTDDSKTHVEWGVLAQQVNGFLPSAVTEGSEDVNDKPWMVSKDSFVIPMLKAMQEQQVMIEALKAEVEALKNA
jgi:hypothetical protein